MGISSVSLKKVGSVALLLNGVIFLSYALLVPTFVHGVHWFITLSAILFLVALPAIYDSLLKANRRSAKFVVALVALAMMVLAVSDLLFAEGSLSPFNHDLAYASGNAMFVICMLMIGVIALKGAYFEWFGYMSILTAIIGLSTYFPQGPSLLSTVSLLLIGLWCLAFGFNITKSFKRATASKVRHKRRRRVR